MLAIFMILMMEAYKSHHNPLPIQLIRHQRISISRIHIRHQFMYGTDSITPKARECKGERVSDEGDVFFEVLLVHLLEEEEILADFMCEVNVLVVKFQIVLVQHIPLPDASVLGETHHLFNTTEEIKLIFSEVGELETVFD